MSIVDLGVTGVDVEPTPGHQPLSCDAAPAPATHYYIVARLITNSPNAGPGEPTGDPTYADARRFGPGWPVTSHTGTVELDWQPKDLPPGTWQAIIVAVDDSGAVIGASSPNGFVIASPDPFPWCQCWFAADGKLHHTAAFAAWYNIFAAHALNGATLAGNFPTHVQVD
jgi:hypothetical protein